MLVDILSQPFEIQIPNPHKFMFVSLRTLDAHTNGSGRTSSATGAV